MRREGTRFAMPSENKLILRLLRLVPPRLRVCCECWPFRRRSRDPREDTCAVHPRDPDPAANTISRTRLYSQAPCLESSTREENSEWHDWKIVKDLGPSAEILTRRPERRSQQQHLRDTPQSPTSDRGADVSEDTERLEKAQSDWHRPAPPDLGGRNTPHASRPEGVR